MPQEMCADYHLEIIRKCAGNCALYPTSSGHGHLSMSWSWKGGAQVQERWPSLCISITSSSHGNATFVPVLREEMDQYDILVLYNIMAGYLMQNGEWREEFNKYT